MSLYNLRAIAIKKGYVIRYTFGITQVASVSSWNPHRESWEVDMADPVIGMREVERIVKNL